MRHLLAAAAVLVLVSSARAEIQSIRPGKYEVTVTMQIPGMPFAPPPTVHTACITKEAIKSKKAFREKAPGCKEDYYHVKGRHITWKMTCKGKGKAGPGTISGDMTTTPTSYNETTTSLRGGRKMIIKMNGKRVGNCP